jgi:hypothetical protein
VTVDSTGLSGARTLFIQPYHHFNIFLGHTAFPWIDAVLRGYDAQARRPNRAQVYLPFGATNATLKPSEPASRSRIILRGGQLEGTAMETVPVESGALNVTFDLLASNDAVTATLMTPDAQPRSLEVIPPRGDGFFGQAWQLVHSEDNPAPGQWKFVISGSNQAAYFLVAVIESPLEVTLRGWPGETVHPGDPLQLEAYASHPAGQPLLRRIEGRVARALPNGVGTLNVSTFNIQHSTFNVHLPGREGIYVISATVTGELPDGTPFERSFVRSVAAVTPDTLTGEPTLLDR